MDANITTEATQLSLGSSTSTVRVTYSDANNLGLANNTFNVTPYDSDMGPRTFKSPMLPAEFIVTLPLYSLIFLLSVVGNVLVIITLIQNKRMRTVTNVFLLNLSISDLLLAVLCMPFTIIPIALRNFVFGPVMCVLIRYLQGVSVSVSCFTLVAISLERYFAICRPLHSRKWQTLSHSYKTIGVCWIFAFVLCIPQAIYQKHVMLPMGNHMCRERWPDLSWHKVYSLFLDMILLVLPIAIMSVSYGKISYTLWSGMKMDKQEMESQNGNGHIVKSDSSRQIHSVSYKDGFGRSVCPSEIEGLHKTRKLSNKMRYDTRGIRQTNNEKSKASKKRVIKMLFAVVLEFFICWAPLFFLQTWMSMDIAHARKHIPDLLLTACFLLSYISSCCNPITYCFMNLNFRNGFRSVFRCCKCNKKEISRTEMPSSYHYSFARTGMSQVSSYDKVKDDSDEL